MAAPVRESLKQIDDDSWLIAGRLVLKRTNTIEPIGHLWKTPLGEFFSIAQAPSPLPFAEQLPSGSFIRKVHDCGDASAVWNFGEAILKVNLIHDRQAATQEATTLKWLADKDLSFPVPKLLYHLQEPDRNYLIISRLPGETLGDIWSELDEQQRSEMGRRVSEIVVELSQWKSDHIAGVDGKFLAEPWINIKARQQDFTPEGLRRVCEAQGMDCSTTIFSHCDLGPYNILVDRIRDTIGIIDWEIAGYVPRAWPRTKAIASWAFMINYTKADFPDKQTLEQEQNKWMVTFGRALGDQGFPEVVDAWNTWRRQ